MLSKLLKFYQDFQISRYQAKARDIAANIASAAVTLADAVDARKTGDGQPLFVMLGENHDQPAHNLMQMQFIRLLRQRGYNPAIGLERPYNLTQGVLAYLREKGGGHPQEPAFSYYLQQASRDDLAHILITDHFCESVRAPLAKKLRNQVLMKDSVCFAFNDAATTKYAMGNDLDLDDPVTRAVMDAHPGLFDVRGPLDATTVMAVHLRNHVMHKHAVNHAASSKADVYIQICGNAHIAGDRGQPDPFPYAESLTRLFQKSGYAVMGAPVFNKDFSLGHLPAGANTDLVLSTLHLSSVVFSKHNAAMEQEWLRAVLPQLDAAYDLKNLPVPLIPQKLR